MLKSGEVVGQGSALKTLQKAEDSRRPEDKLPSRGEMPQKENHAFLAGPKILWIYVITILKQGKIML